MLLLRTRPRRPKPAHPPDASTWGGRQSTLGERAAATRLRFAGIPGRSYDVQRAPAVDGPWTTLATLVAPLHGIIEHLDANPPPGAAFYRTVAP